MNDLVNFSYNIDVVWNTVKLIRDKVASLIATQGDELVDACKMTSSELVENAIKYGCTVESGKGIEFAFSLGEGEVRISVTNGVISQADIENVRAHIDEIKAASNPQALYIKRLTTLLENPDLKQSQLGLYRIAFEGEFELQYSYDEPKKILTVTATKKI